MEIQSIFLNFIGTLRETYKIFLKNGILMATTALSIISLFSLLYIINYFSTKPLISTLIRLSFLLMTSPNSTEYASILLSMQKDIKLFVGLEWLFVFMYSIASIFIYSATIYASAITHDNRNLPIHDLVLTTRKLMKRPLVTYFYISIFSLGYLILMLCLLLPLALPRENIATTLACILAGLFYVYLSVVWTLGLVVSVLEDKYGIEALGKASQIVKGMKIHGFALNILITVFSVVVSQIWRFDFNGKSSTLNLLVGMVVLDGLCLVRMFGLVAFTEFYYQCKNYHGEEGELVINMEYTKLPTSTPLMNENIL